MKTKSQSQSQGTKPNVETATTHPVGTGLGAAAGAAMGAAAGSVAGPIGTLVGAAGGAVVGGSIGGELASAYNPEAEEAHWREKYQHEPYFHRDFSFDDYAPAYRYAGERYRRGLNFEAAEKDMGEGWEAYRGSSRLDWTRARDAARAGWERLDQAPALFPPA
ncbi:hypothetical protein [Luteolibacter sp. Populi]|uniref:hypothetical protein n=1 Tax=Luteolibacter sp. Populi TaxID=3230487 RepID=UPI003466A48D